RRPLLIVTRNTRIHRSRLFSNNHLALGDWPMTALAFHARLAVMNLMREPHIIRYLVDLDPRDRLLSLMKFCQLLDRRAVSLHGHMAAHTRRFSRKACSESG